MVDMEEVVGSSVLWKERKTKEEREREKGRKERRKGEGPIFVAVPVFAAVKLNELLSHLFFLFLPS